MPRPLMSFILVVSALSPATLLGQDAARVRLEREAAGQAAQADKLLKAGRHAAALKLYRAEFASRKTLGDARYEAFALRGIGCCLVEIGDEVGAVDAFIEARKLDANRDDKGYEGYDGLLLAKTYVRLGRHADAESALERAMPKLDQAIDRDHECDARICLVTVRLRLGQAEKAQADARRAIALAEDLDDPRRLADAWLGSGLIAHELDRLSLALERIQDARDAYREQNRRSDLALATRHLAHLSYRLGGLDRAARRFAEAIAIHAKLGDRESESTDRLDLATIHLDRGDPVAAIREAALARDGFKDLGNEVSEIDALVVLAQAHSRETDGLEPACAALKETTLLGSKTYRDAPKEQIRLLLLSAEMEHRLQRRSEVAAQLDVARTLATKAEDKSLRDLVDQTQARLVAAPIK